MERDSCFNLTISDPIVREGKKEKEIGMKGLIPEVGVRPPKTGFIQRFAPENYQGFCRIMNKNKAKYTLGGARRIGPQRALSGIRGRIPINDLHKSASEGEGACSRTSAGRSHLPLRGKLGWMTPRPGQKKAGKRDAS
jgi:hypothetical protein